MERQVHLDIEQVWVEELLTKNGKCVGILSQTDTAYLGKAIILTRAHFSRDWSTWEK